MDQLVAQANRKFLLNQRDPVGVAYLVSDEYDCMIAPLLKKLLDGAGLADVRSTVGCAAGARPDGALGDGKGGASRQEPWQAGEERVGAPVDNDRHTLVEGAQGGGDHLLRASPGGGAGGAGDVEERGVGGTRAQSQHAHAARTWSRTTTLR